MIARKNPFNTEQILKIRYQLQSGTWEELLGRLKQFNYRAAIIGPEGSGKTTLLEDLQPHLLRYGFIPVYLRLRPEGKLNISIRELTSSHILLLDGSESLSIFTWMRLKLASHKLGGLIITAHQPGRLPTLIRCSTNAELLSNIVYSLVESVSNASKVNCTECYSKYNGNIREALRAHYDEWATKDD